MSLVEVEWFDSEHVDLGWADPEEYKKALRDRTTYRTVGWLIDQTDDHLIIVMNRSDSGMVGNGMVIPRACVTAVNALGKGAADLRRNVADMPGATFLDWLHNDATRGPESVVSRTAVLALLDEAGTAA